MEAKFYIGYGLLEDWAGAADPALPVYATLVETPVGSTYGVETKDVEVRVFQVRDGQAHYCLLRVATLQYAHGRPLDQDADRRRRAAESAWEAVHAWLEERGFTVRRATVAVPRNLTLMRGWAGFLEYDRETHLYRIAEAVAA